ncbi:MAG: hypothetical protein FVQ80_08985 [Planctomycetes bacterium]|nr:hypothetical protein [Planctomycetota bacterium]
MKLPKNKKGLILVLAIVAIAIFAIMAISMASLGFQSRIRAIRTERETAARAAADAGHDAAIFELNRLLDAWTGVLPQATAPVALSGSDQIYTYSVVPTAGIPAGLLAFDVASVGTAGRVQRKVFSRTVLVSVFSFAILVKDTIELKANATVDGYNSAEGPYGGANSGLPVEIGTNDDDGGDITLRRRVVISDGSSLIVGVGALDDPEAVVDDRSGFEGDIFASLVEIPFPDVTMSIGGLVNLGDLDVPKNNTVTISSGRYLYDKITVNQNATLEIEGSVIVNVLAGGMLLKKNAELIVKGTPDSSLELYLDGNFNAKAGTEVTNDTQDPTKLQIFGTSNATSIILKNSADFYGAIYAPYAELDMRNSGDLFGSFVGDSLILHNSVNFHYDTALQIADPNDEGVRFVPTRWYEE